MMLFAIVFGLSMDYEVFLLSRIKEEYDRTGDNATAVADGLAVDRPGHHRRRADHGVRVLALRRSATVASSKLFGLGLAVAVLIDATLVRMVLVPATMELLGDRNWWLPELARSPASTHPHRGSPRSDRARRLRRIPFWSDVGGARRA